MTSASVSIPTDHGSRYLQQLCKHWSHNLKVDFDAERGSVVIPRDARGSDFPGDGLITFQAEERSLRVRIDASSADQLETIKTVVAEHLDRFAFREAPLSFHWQ